MRFILETEAGTLRAHLDKTLVVNRTGFSEGSFRERMEPM